MTARDIVGQWWLSTNDIDRWLGTLKIQPGKTPRLSLLIPKGFEFKADWDTPAVFHGHDEHGNPITLLSCCPPARQQSAALTRLEMTVGTALIGIHIRGASDFTAHSLVLRMQHLFEWGNISGLRTTFGEASHDINSSYRRPQDQRFQISADLSVELRSAYWRTAEAAGHKDEEDLLIAFESKVGLGWNACKDLISAMRQLLHFASLETVYPMTVLVQKQGHGREWDGKLMLTDIEVISGLNRERVRSEAFPDRWVFQYCDVCANFGEFLRKWMDYVKQFDEVLDCYFTTVYHPLPDSVEHLCLTQAFDAYHGYKFASHNQFGYENKVFEITDPHKNSLNGLVADPADFAKTVTQNRNWYTHHNPKEKLKGRVVSGADLTRLNEKLKLVLQMNILTDMGIAVSKFTRLRRQLASQIVEFV